MKVYNISSKEDALNTIVELTRTSRDVVLEFIESNIVVQRYSLNGEKLTAENYFSELGVDEELIDIINLGIYASHYTTSNDNCSSILEFGLRDLKHVVSNNTMLRNFLKDNGVHFSIDSQTLMIGNREFSTSYNQGRYINDDDLTQIAFKINKDSGTSCFLFTQDVKTYLGNVHLCPEILLSLDNLSPELDLQTKWKKLTKGYRIDFIVPIDEFDYLCSDITDGNKLYNLLDHALRVAADLCSNEIIACLKLDVIVTKEMIVGIDEII